jgi:hypothetical protein
MGCFPPLIMRSSWRKKVVTDSRRGMIQQAAFTIQLTSGYI